MTASCVPLAIDHLTLAALTLEQGVDCVGRALGVEVPPGDAHWTMGTHNHVMELGERIFLEIIATDPTVMPQRTRWFALDDVGTKCSPGSKHDDGRST